MTQVESNGYRTEHVFSSLCFLFIFHKKDVLKWYQRSGATRKIENRSRVAQYKKRVHEQRNNLTKSRIKTPPRHIAYCSSREMIRHTTNQGASDDPLLFQCIDHPLSLFRRSRSLLNPSNVSPTLPCHVPIPSRLSFLSDYTYSHSNTSYSHTQEQKGNFPIYLSPQQYVYFCVKCAPQYSYLALPLHPGESPLTSSPFTFSISSTHLEPRPEWPMGPIQSFSHSSWKTHKRQRGSHFFFTTLPIRLLHPPLLPSPSLYPPLPIQ